MFSHDVKLPRDQVPRFPDRCVACGVEGPGDILKVSHRPLSFLPFLFPIAVLFQSKLAASAPACADCRRRCRRDAWRRDIQSLVLFTLLVVLLFRNEEALLPESRSLRKLALLGYLVAAMVPSVVPDVLWPRAFDITPYGRSVDYEFADADYARQFAARNGGRVD